MKFVFGFRRDFEPTLDGLNLPKQYRTIIDGRFVNEVSHAERSYFLTRVGFYFLSNFITVGSALVAAFISIQKIEAVPYNVQMGFFWTSLALSIVVVLANKLLYSFNLQKKYVNEKAALEKFRSEGWSYASGIDRYANLATTAAFLLFMSRIEKIRLKVVKNSLSDDTTSTILQTAAHVDSVYPTDFVTAGVDNIAPSTAEVVEASEAV